MKASRDPPAHTTLLVRGMLRDAPYALIKARYEERCYSHLLPLSLLAFEAPQWGTSDVLAALTAHHRVASPRSGLAMASLLSSARGRRGRRLRETCQLLSTRSQLNERVRTRDLGRLREIGNQRRFAHKRHATRVLASQSADK